MTRPLSTDRVRGIPRRDVAYKESTRDPIFLFQIADYGFSTHDIDAMEAMGWHCDEGWYTSDKEDADHVTDEMMLSHEIGTKHWYTRAVFLNREEGRIHGQGRPYAWGDEGVGWRVYCVCAEGDLAALIVQSELDAKAKAEAQSGDES